mmetsp:Transcript_15714/g.27932  ORF Transcript_15714/g.27932 Transcript_15714/m.27932 type:complete len:300 (-) Transcript_15714:160-1059(-)
MIDGNKDLDGYDMDQGLNTQHEEAVPMPSSEEHDEVEHDDLDIEEEQREAREAATAAVSRAQDMVEQHGGMMLLVLVASAVLLLEASVACASETCAGDNGFAVAAGVVSLIVTAGFLFLQRSSNLSDKLRLGLVVFLFVWWVIIAYITTFEGPFQVPGNGYFAAWLGLVAILKVLSHDVAKVRETVGKLKHLGFKMGVLMVGSVVVILAGWGKCNGGCGGSASYAIAAGIVSFIIGLVQLLAANKLSDGARKYMMMFLVVWWLIAFVVLTFVNPFRTVGNGYFATAACTGASLLMYTHT